MQIYDQESVTKLNQQNAHKNQYEIHLNPSRKIDSTKKTRESGTLWANTMPFVFARTSILVKG